MAIAPASGAAAEQPSVAFYYGRPLPVRELSRFNWVVVEPENTQPSDLDYFKKSGVEVFGYLSVGEVNRAKSWSKEVDPSWLLGFNAGWNSNIIDPIQKGWHRVLLKQMKSLWDAGYRGFFLDTLDSYESVLKTDAQKEARVAGLAELIRAMHERFPGVRLIFNRGFPLLPKVGGLAVALVAESLFETWDPNASRYVAAEPSETQWLNEQLEIASKQFRLPVIVIDYVPPGSWEKARATALKIAALGYIPWIANSSLDILGVGSIEVVPRRVLLVYKSDESRVCDSSVHRLIAPILEYWGYVPDYLDVLDELPDYPLTGLYSGLITWFNSHRVPDVKRYRDWLLRQINAGIKVAIFARLGFEPDAPFLRRLGLEPVRANVRPPFSQLQTSELVGLEAKPVLPLTIGFPWAAKAQVVQNHLSIVDSAGQFFTAVVTGPWGGMAMDPFLLQQHVGDHMRWILDPRKFLQAALQLPPLPAPDVTTENGRRLLMIHIDGDGIANRATMPGTPLAGEVIVEQILKRYRLPTTVSVIEGEVAPHGVYPQVSTELEEISREMFALPHVELASHTFSHPFDWDKLPIGQSVEEVNRPLPPDDKLTLSVPNYRFSLEREIAGSTQYINSRLAPPGKQVKVFLWSGTANPQPDAVAMATSIGLVNVNGGNTTITEENASLTEVAPSGCPKKGDFQVYAPVQNENVYTNNWRGPFFGFNQVIGTFRLTDLPARLKPISIYYHFYSGSKVASLKTLEDIYRWALSQETFPIWLSEYAVKVRDFNSATLVRKLDGGWQIDGLSDLRTLRLPKELGWPDLERSKGVIGVRDLPQGRYVAVSGNGRVELKLTESAPSRPYLEWANAAVIRWQPTTDQQISFRLKGHLPVEMAVAGSPRRCKVIAEQQEIKSMEKDGTQTFSFSSVDTGPAVLRCL